MLSKKNQDPSKQQAHKMREAINKAYEEAIQRIESKAGWDLSDRFRNALDGISDNSKAASAVFTNIITCLAIKVAMPQLDVRKHQSGIGAPFNFRGVSENIIYPWLSLNKFDGAKSGWQTRTLERPKPYTMDYSENIARVKTEFLTCFDEVQEKGSSALEGLVYLLNKQISKRQVNEKILANIEMADDDDIATIVGFFDRHFTSKYTGKGASRLPVLAMYSVYTLLTKQISRYADKALLPLKSHSAADEQTGAMGDIEIAREDGTIFEAFEIKHGIQIGELLVRDAEKKLIGHGLDRYYILTTHPNCKPTPEILALLKHERERTGCQIIVNGVIPTIQYYLRLLSEPARIIPEYIELLKVEPAIDSEHRATWAEILKLSTTQQWSEGSKL